MSVLSPVEAQALVREGVAALGRGDHATARAALQPIADTGRASRDVLVMLARACRGDGDDAAAHTHLDAALRKDAGHVPALLAKGDLLQDNGDARGATRFYRAALAQGSDDPGMARAQAALQANQAAFGDHLEAELARAGHGHDHRTPHFQLALDILHGRTGTDMGIQRPATFFMPGLPQRTFYERTEFAWAPALEAQTDAIRDELDSLQEESFRPYLVSNPDEPRRDVHGLLDNPDWSTLYLWENGAATEVVDRVPRTWEAVSGTQLCFIGPYAPSVLFSLLKAGARIPAHSGVTNARLICHLPLEVPPGCGFRVGEDVRQWREGELTVFDDSVEHEAWNNSAERRVVLIFDVWRPELEPEERDAITAMFAAIEAYGR